MARDDCGWRANWELPSKGPLMSTSDNDSPKLPRMSENAEPSQNPIAERWLWASASAFLVAIIVFGADFVVFNPIDRGSLFPLAISIGVVAIGVGAYGLAALRGANRCPTCGCEDTTAAGSTGFVFRHNRHCNGCSTVWQPRVPIWAGVLAIAPALAASA